MAFSKITRIILYVVAGISLLVVLFFYVAPNTVKDVDELDRRVMEAQNPVDLMPLAPLPEADSMSTDSTSVADSTAVAAAPVAPVEPVVQEIQTASDVLSGWEMLVWKRTDIILSWSYILALLTMLAAIVFPMISVISTPKRLVRLGAVLAGTAVIVVVAYLFSSDAVLEIVGYDGTANSDAGTLKMVDTVLFVTYMLAGLAIGSILYAIISKALK